LKFFKEEKTDLFDVNKIANSRILITGITGFVGSHLAQKLLQLEQDISIHGICRRQAVPLMPNIREIIEKINIYEANLIDYTSLERIIKKIEPDYIFHLAAQSFVPTSFEVPIESVKTNIEGTINILEVLRNTNFDLEAMQVACSSEQYGLVYSDEIPINENNPFRPQSPYAVSKVATELYSRTYFQAYGIPIRITRGFNHTGPRRGMNFVASVIASQVAQILESKRRKIILGNIKPIRDFTDIRDMIQGYILANTKGKNGESYNLGHGFGISVENLLKLTTNLFDIEYELEIDKGRYRPAEVDVLICDYSKAKKELGYKPQYPLTETMESLVEYYRTDDVIRNYYNNIANN
jgi:GDP-4-dehydro-6-deoxy-D-mannose reductase